MGSGGKPLDIYGTTPANGTRLVERGMSWAGTGEETTREERAECVRAAASTDWSYDPRARGPFPQPRLRTPSLLTLRVRVAGNHRDFALCAVARRALRILLATRESGTRS